MRFWRENFVIAVFGLASFSFPSSHLNINELFHYKLPKWVQFFRTLVKVNLAVLLEPSCFEFPRSRENRWLDTRGPSHLRSAIRWSCRVIKSIGRRSPTTADYNGDGVKYITEIWREMTGPFVNEIEAVVSGCGQRRKWNGAIKLESQRERERERGGETA